MKKLIGSKMRFSIGATILFAILTISNSCTKDSTMYGMGSNSGSTGSPGANEVWIGSMAFNPSVITVAAGTTITWTNKATIDHTVTSDKGLFDSGNIGSDGTFSFKFTTAGSYPYHCAIHPSMKAKVVVN